MTEQEAIERLKCMKLFMQISDKDNESKFLDEDYEANAMAIKALEKQMPKKTKIKKGCNWIFKCPSCDKTLCWTDESKNHFAE